MTQVIHIQWRKVIQPLGKASSWQDSGPGAHFPGCSLGEPPHLFPAAAGLLGVGPSLGEQLGRGVSTHCPGPSPNSGTAINTEDEVRQGRPEAERQSGHWSSRQRKQHEQRPWGRTQLGTFEEQK